MKTDQLEDSCEFTHKDSITASLLSVSCFHTKNTKKIKKTELPKSVCKIHVNIQTNYLKKESNRTISMISPTSILKPSKLKLLSTIEKRLSMINLPSVGFIEKRKCLDYSWMLAERGLSILDCSPKYEKQSGSIISSSYHHHIIIIASSYHHYIIIISSP